MIDLRDYAGREQSYVKHVFLERYLESLVHKTASKFDRIAYIDGFAGPWQSANEKLQDTSFGIALNALRRAKASWKPKRDVQMSAFLVERDASAYAKLAQIKDMYPDINIKTYNADFLEVLPAILGDVPRDAFSFFLLDPKGWRISLNSLRYMLARPNSEVVFNFMFDFINRAASIADPAVANGLDELIPFGNWRETLQISQQTEHGELTPEQRKAILVGAFTQSLMHLGNYRYVAETAVLRTDKDRPLYCLFYATRHPKGIEVFRDSQIKALVEQSKVRAATKIRQSESASGQTEIFSSLHDMAPDDLTMFLQVEKRMAEKLLIGLTPKAPDSILYGDLRARVLARHVVKTADVNSLAASLRRDAHLHFLDWEQGKRVPQGEYRAQRRD